ncbi:nucleoskeletal-like protein [Carpediemonas membranifera]|uniref:Nucleoskeletal-like protein n=1 Tax=Carpediemonas membranifera TaxID=201153 RepID=A0A8J6B9C7_9EUKA|nr:nucleoskeletal-like protein [Carpediemonas membranifera]|eukprot:KAG9392682.1 nucleoskeletal-like protein [Carpediemonas membranifera]
MQVAVPQQPPIKKKKSKHTKHKRLSSSIVRISKTPTVSAKVRFDPNNFKLPASSFARRQPALMSGTARSIIQSIASPAGPRKALEAEIDIEKETATPIITSKRSPEPEPVERSPTAFTPVPPQPSSQTPLPVMVDSAVQVTTPAPASTQETPVWPTKTPELTPRTKDNVPSLGFSALKELAPAKKSMSFTPDTKANDKAVPAPAPPAGFSFGAKPQPAEDKKADPKTGLAFGQPAKPEEKDGKPKNGDQKSSWFTFGSKPADKPAEKSAEKAPEKPAEAPKPAFSFGAAAKPAAPVQPEAQKAESKAVPAFSFGGAKPAETPKEAPKAGFTFGSGQPKPTQETTSADKPTFGFTSQPAATAFSFGAKAAPEPKKDATAFAFGGQARPTGDAKPTFGFTSQPSQPAAPASSAFAFGSGPSPASDPKPNPFASAPAAQSSPFGQPAAPAPTGGSVFGQPASNPSGPAAASAPSPFGPAATPGQSTPFGAAPSPAPRGFGAPPPSTSNSANPFMAQAGFGGGRKTRR